MLALLDDSDQEELKRQLDDLAASFHQHLFGCEAFIVEQWVEDKEAELVAMATSAVQVQPLQVQHFIEVFACLFVCLQWLHGSFLLLAGMQVIIMQIIICTM